jgi:hypothetical protein
MAEVPENMLTEAQRIQLDTACLRTRAVLLAQALADFPVLVEDYIRLTGQSPSAFGLAAVRAPDFVHKLRGQRTDRGVPRWRHDTMLKVATYIIGGVE